jgi:D-glucosaminate-6-phosphate ammonia-lyase
MNRRDLLKGLPFLPLAGAMMAAAGLPDVANGATVPLSDLPGATGPFTSGEVVGSVLGLPAEENIFRAIGVEPLINCRGTFTIIGGSLERTSVRSAMDSASRSFVQYDELADGIGSQLAKLTGAPWGMVSAGCAAGLKHVTAACVSGGNPEILIRIPDLTGLDKTEVIIPFSSRNVYDHAIRNIGVKIITVQNMEELETRLNASVAMIYISSEETGSFPLDQVVKLAKNKQIPVLVDAAAEDLTVPNIHLQQGADVVAYSGGKALCGPQCAGLLLGNKEILQSAWQASSPHHGPGRDNKVGREEMIGMLGAVEAWLSMDHKAQWNKWMSMLRDVAKTLSTLEGVTTEIKQPTELSNKSPLMIIKWNVEKLQISGEEVAEILGKTKPRIALGSGGSGTKETGMTSIDITTGQMQPGEEKIVASRILAILSEKRTAPSSSMKTPAFDMSGRWEATVNFFSSQTQHVLTLRQDGNWLQGSHKSNFSVQDIEGTIEGDKLKLKSSVRRPGDHITYLFTGTVSANNITGVIFMGEYRTASFTAVKQKEKSSHDYFMIPSGPPLAT